MYTVAPRKLVVVPACFTLAVLAVLAVGCGSDAGPDRAAPTIAITPANGSIASLTNDPPASLLRSQLTTELQEHVYLVGARALATTKPSGPASESDRPLASNAAALGTLFRRAYGPAVGTRFRRVWDRHVSNLIAYSDARAANDGPGLVEALRAIRRDQTAIGSLVASVQPDASTEAVAAQLSPSVNSLITALDAVIAHRPEAFTNLTRAASQMPIVAQVLAEGVAGTGEARPGG